MEWTNSVILEFLNSYEKYPVIWDPKNVGHKNRNEVREAWNCIRDEMSVDFPVETLKKKKESLMATYRYLRRKVIDSAKYGIDDVHKPSWFAFETMDRFLNSAVKSMNTQDNITDEIDDPILNDDIHEFEIKEQPEFEDEGSSTTNTKAYEAAVAKPVQNILRPPKRRRLTPRGESVTKYDIAKCMKRASDVFKTISHQHHPPHQQEQPDECSLYGQLLATKLRALDKRTRTIVINKIDNLVFNAQMYSIDPLPSTSYESFSEDSHQFSPLVDDYSDTTTEIDVKSPSIRDSHLHTGHSTL